MKKGMKIALGALAAVGTVLAALGVYFRVNGSHSIAVIGGADGPTSIYVAGKISERTAAGWMVAGGAMLACAFGGLWLYLRKKKK